MGYHFISQLGENFIRVCENLSQYAFNSTYHKAVKGKTADNVFSTKNLSLSTEGVILFLITFNIRCLIPEDPRIRLSERIIMSHIYLQTDHDCVLHLLRESVHESESANGNDRSLLHSKKKFQNRVTWNIFKKFNKLGGF